MSSSQNIDHLIRKLRKKLRQIENLERLNRPLTEEEIIKVDSKFTVREKLQSALEERQEIDAAEANDETADAQKEHNVSKEEKTSEDRQEKPVTKVSSADRIQHSASKRSEHESENREIISGSDPRTGKGTQPGHDHGDTGVKGQKTKAKRPPPLSESLCRISWLEGHSDLITALVVDGTQVVTASRDTTLKCWDILKGKELRSFGGHTETVTSLCVVKAPKGLETEEPLTDGDKILISGSFDCTFKLWSLKTGKQLKSVYTYNPVVQICYCSHLERLVTGSDGGKLELWNLTSGENCFSSRAYDACVTGIKVDDKTVYSSSSDGIIKVHQITEKGELLCVFVSETVKTASGQFLIPRHIRCLELGPNGLLFGDDSRNVKVLDWKKGLITKVPNHTNNFTSTDAIFCCDSYLLTSSYDLDEGLGYVNVRHYKTYEYLATVDDYDTDRIVCLGFTHLPSGNMVIVTGGMELKLWELISDPASKKRAEGQEDVINLDFRPALAEPAIDSEAESSDESDDSSVDYEEEVLRCGLEKDTSVEGGWLSWCNVL